MSSIDKALCLALTNARNEYKNYLRNAIRITGTLLPNPSGPDSSVIAQFEIIHNDRECQLEMADVCVHILSTDTDVTLVAQDYNYVSYWQHLSSPKGGFSGWDLLAAGQGATSHEICILGQSLHDSVPPQIGAGYLHYVENYRPGDGWTVAVGLEPKAPRTEFHFEIRVSARPDWVEPTAARSYILTT